MCVCLFLCVYDTESVQAGRSTHYMIFTFVTLSLPMIIYHMLVLETTPSTASQSSFGVKKIAHGHNC